MKIKVDVVFTGHLKSLSSCTDLSLGNQPKGQAEFLTDWMNFVSKSHGFSSYSLQLVYFAKPFTALLS